MRLILTIYLATIIQVALCAPAERNIQFDVIEETVPSATETLADSKGTVNKVKDYINNAIETIKKKGGVTVESLNAIADKLLKIGENVKNVAAGKASNLYGDILEKSAVYFEIVDSELRSFFSDIKPNVGNINNSVKGAINSISDNVGGILNNLMHRVGQVINSPKKEDWA